MGVRFSSKAFNRKMILSMAVASIASMAMSLPVHAAATWSPTAATSSWSTLDNWSADPATDVATFSGTGYSNGGIVTVDATALSTHGINDTGSGTITINNSGGFGLSIDAGGITKAAGSGALIISAPLTLTANQIWSNASSSGLTLQTGGISGAGFDLGISNTGGAGGALTVSSAVSNVGTLSLTQSNSGTGAYTLSGGVTGVTNLNISRTGPGTGVMTIGTAGIIGSGSGTLTETNASTSTAGIALSAPISGFAIANFSNAASAASAVAVSGAITGLTTMNVSNTGNTSTMTIGAGAISGTGTLTINNTGTRAVTISGPISGYTAVNQTVSGGGITVLSAAGAAGMGGNWNISNGTIKGGVVNSFSPLAVVTLGGAGTNGTLDLGNFSQTIGGLADGASGGGFERVGNSGAGNVVLTVNTINGSSTFGGSILNTLPLGTGTVGLTIQGSNTLNLTGLSNYTGVTSGNGTINYVGQAAGNAQFFGALAFTTAGSLRIQSTYGGAGVTDLNFTGATITHTVGATGNFTTSGGNAGNNRIFVGTIDTAGAIVGNWLTFGSGANTQYALFAAGQVGGFTGTSITDINAATSSAINYEASSLAGATLTAARTANTLRYSGAGQTIATNGNTLTLTGILNAGTGTLAFSGGSTGGVSPSGPETVLNAANADIEFTGAFNGNSTTAQTVILTGPNKVLFNTINNLSTQTTTYTSAAQANDLMIGSSQALVLNAASTGGITINPSIVDNTAGASSLTINSGSTGTVTLNTASTYTGATNLIRGTLALGYTNSTNNTLPSGTALNMAGPSTSSATLMLTGKAGVASVQTVASTLFDIGRSAITLNAVTSPASMTLNLNGITRNPGATAIFTLNTNTSLTTTSNSNTNGIMGAWAMAGQNYATVSGAAPGVISAYAGSTVPAGLSIASDATSNVQVTSNNNVTATSSTLNFTGANNTISVANAALFSIGDAIGSLTAAATGGLTPGSLNIPTGTTITGVDTGTNTLTLSQPLFRSGTTPTGTAAMTTITATHVLTLGGGTTDLNTLMIADNTPHTLDVGSGTLRLGTIGGIWRSTATATSADVMNIIGTGTITAGGPNIDTNGEIVLRMDGATNIFAASLAQQFSTIAPAIVDNGLGVVTVTKTGNQSLILAGPNSYTGKTYVTQGTLQAATIGGGDIYVTDGAQFFASGATYNNNFFVLGAGPTVNFGSVQAAAGAIRLGATTTLSSSGKITLLGNTFFSNGTTGSIATIAAQITGNFAVQFNAAGQLGTSLRLSNPIADNLAGGNSWTGDTTVAGQSNSSGSSTLFRLGADEQIPSGAGKGNLLLSNSGINASATFLLDGHNETINGLNASGAYLLDNKRLLENGNATTASTFTFGDNNASGNFIGQITNGGTAALNLKKIGTGYETFAGTVSHTGSTTITAGTLTIDPTQIATGNVVNPTDYFSKNSAIVLNGGTLAITGRDNSAGTTQNSTYASGATFIPIANIAGLYVGQTITGTGLSSYIQTITPTGVNVANATTALSTAAPVTVAASTNVINIQNLKSLALTADSALQADGGQVAVIVTNGPINAGGFNLTLKGGGVANNSLSASVSNGSLTKSGAGTWVLTNASNSYTGATTITGGTLKLAAASNNIASSTQIIVGDSLADNAAKLDVTGITGFTLAGTQSIGGHGTVVGDVATSSGTIISPGNSIGTTTFQNALNLAQGTVLSYDFAAPGSSDLTAVQGLLTLPTDAGSITLNLTDVGGLTTGTYTLFTYNTIAGGNLTFNDTFAVGNPDRNDTYLFSDTGTRINLTIAPGTPAPEPASLMLLGLGGVALLARGRRRR